MHLRGKIENPFLGGVAQQTLRQRTMLWRGCGKNERPDTPSHAWNVGRLFGSIDKREPAGGGVRDKFGNQRTITTLFPKAICATTEAAAGPRPKEWTLKSFHSGLLFEGGLESTSTESTRDSARARTRRPS